MQTISHRKKKFFKLFVLHRGQKFLSWLPILHKYCQTRENLNFCISPERAQTISDILVSTVTRKITTEEKLLEKFYKIWKIYNLYAEFKNSNKK